MKNFTFKFAIQSITRSHNFLMRIFLKSIMCGEMRISCPTRESVFWYNFSGNNLILGIKPKNGFIPFDLVLEAHTIFFFKLKMWTKYLLCQPTNINSWIFSWHPFNRAEKKSCLFQVLTKHLKILLLPSSGVQKLAHTWSWKLIVKISGILWAAVNKAFNKNKMI